jgi:N-acetyl-anhydromuramyl-L-alanine amidase AmpD
VLHDLRGLSVHLMLDLDGTIYQTLDLKERAWHATSSNSRSVGIEIANVGAYSTTNRAALETWYQREDTGAVRIGIPERFGDGGIRTPGFIGRPARPEPVEGIVQGQPLAQYDFTPEQYAALIKLTAALCRTLPKIRCDYPRDAEGNLIARQLSPEHLAHYQGLLGHYHIQADKVDPGPAFQWERVVKGARRWLRRDAVEDEKPATRLMRVTRSGGR